MKMCEKEISKLGFGMMRLPKKENGEFDYEQVNKMVDRYIESGGNYFDTAYVYAGSEVATGKSVVERYPRDAYYLASKMPSWELRSEEDFTRIFEEQLARTGAEYFDYYLMHSISSPKSYSRYQRFRCFEQAQKLKDEGKIRNLGFSFHSDPATMQTVLNEHPEVDFVQLQINYADWHSPTIYSKPLYEMVRAKNLPIIVMEPVKGGLLANLTQEVRDVFTQCDPEASVASWALRYTASMEGVVTNLSGMSNMEQMEDNIKTFTNFAPLTHDEDKVIQKAMDILERTDLIACTGCQYCVKGCPVKIQIPMVFSISNYMRMAEDTTPYRKRYSDIISGSGKASDCISCGKCNEICPQKLDIPTLLGDCAKILD